MLRKEVQDKYTLLENRFLQDQNAEAFFLEHKQSGARVAILKNDDANKVFYIGFRTPPTDSTGVAHIVEHTVLCGSRDFPVKDPFIELVKGSLNTFLNAMTYPDKTVYPIASCNEQDFRNLMHVYLDAVFYPDIYRKEEIFRQEGWRYEKTDGKLSLNGVVYNEMKGALSSPEDVLENAVYASLFPDTVYANESGGNPKAIPELSYEKFLDFHRRYYHPSNSYIYLYGDMDFEERLVWMDRAYLSAFDRMPVNSAIAGQPQFEKPGEYSCSYAVLPDEDEKGKDYLSLCFALPGAADPGSDMAFKVLDYVLCDAEGAPLKEAVYSAGLCEEFSSVYENGILQPYESFTARYSDADRKEEFRSVIRNTLENLCRNGIDRRSLEAAISSMEFRYREADFGTTPKGLVYGLAMMETWLYDDNKPFARLNIGEVFDWMRKKAEEGFFEDLLRRCFLENTHSSLVVMKAEKGLAEAEEEKQAERLAAYEHTLSEADWITIEEKEAALKKWQETPDREEDLLKIPMLKRGDLKQEAPSLKTEILPDFPVPALAHNLFTNGILYLNFLFDLKKLTEEEFLLLPIYKTLFSALNTENYSYTELDQEIHILTGGFSAGVSFYTDIRNRNRTVGKFEIAMKVFPWRLHEAMELLREILFATDFSDRKRIREILEEERSAMRSSMTGAAHIAASVRALSYFSESGRCLDETGGIAANRYIDRILNHYDEQFNALSASLRQLNRKLYSKGNFMLDVTAQAELLPPLSGETALLQEMLYPEVPDAGRREFVPEFRQEGFMTAGQVQYVCCAGNFADRGFAYTGALRILKVILGYDYLWNMVRVKGGAYGCMSSFSRDGSAFFVSFRDPHLKNTVDVFSGIPDYLSAFEADERNMTKYIIGAVSTLDHPLTPPLFGRFCLSAALTGMTDEDLQQERNEVLEAGPETIRALSDLTKSILEDHAFCVIGTRRKIEEYKDLFGHTEKLF